MQAQLASYFEDLLHTPKRATHISISWRTQSPITGTLRLTFHVQQSPASSQQVVRGLFLSSLLRWKAWACRSETFGAEELIRSEEHTSELQSLMRISYAVFCLK